MTVKPQTEAPALLRAVSTMLGVPVLHIRQKDEPLHGGTLGDVRLLVGEAETGDGRTLPYRMVHKTQKRWERPGDSASWRREYDLYNSAFSTLFTNSFRAPAVYQAETTETENSLWMEYIQGRSGTQLTLEDCENAALALGRFQGRCMAQSNFLQQIDCLGDSAYMERDFAQWTPDTVEYQYLRSDGCALPAHLQDMLVATQEQAARLFSEMRRLPLVLCHRDYWSENIFASDAGIVAIDWDCAGWGFAGEDIASLIADETEPALIGMYAQRLAPAYLRGLTETTGLPPGIRLPIREMILFKFGYRLLQQVLFAQSPTEAANAILALEQIRALRPVG